MHSRVLPLLAVAALAPWHPLGAQRAATRTGTLAGMRFTLPARFVPVATLSDTSTAVYADSARRVWAFVSLLPSAGARPAVVRRIARRVAGEVIGSAADTVEWQVQAGLPADTAERFHQRLMTLGNSDNVDITFRQFRAGGRDLLVGSAFVAHDQEALPLLCGITSSAFGAEEAAERIAASLLGRSQPVFATGFQELTPGSRPSATRPDPARQRVLDTFDQYARAIRAHDRAATRLVAPAVLAFYQDIRTLALHASAAEMRALPLGQRLAVLMLRSRVDIARLRAMSSEDVFVLMEVENGTFDESFTAGELLLRSAPGIASVVLFERGRRTSIPMGFVRTEGTWRVDDIPTTAIAGCMMRASWRSQGVTRDQEDLVLLGIVERLTGRTTAPDIWEPLEKSAAAP